MRSRTLPFLVILAVVGCASAGAAGGSAGTGGATASAGGASATTARPTRGSLNLITNAEIEGAGNDIMNAYDLVLTLRPSMLRFRNQTAGLAAADDVLGVVAYVDEVRLGSPENLRTVMRGIVREIRYLNASDATTRWGTNHTSGAIQVITKR